VPPRAGVPAQPRRKSPQSEAELAEIARRLDRPVLANLVNGGHTPMLGAKRLQELGFKVTIYPVAGFLAAAAALDSAYSEILETGNSLGERTPIYPFADFSRLMGFGDVWSFERRFPQD
jgi:2-methylisocitrate lyase-like PEP mutase family enzyme